MSYRRTPFTPGGNVEEYLLRELERIEEQFDAMQQGFGFRSMSAPPVKPRLGMVVLADGTNWNPLGFAEPQLVAYDGTKWIPSTGIEVTPWTPTFTFATPGDVSVTYGGGAQDRLGVATRIGDLIHLRCRIFVSSLTHTTASGNAVITGLPFTIAAPNTMGVLSVQKVSGAVNWPASTTHLHCGLDTTGTLTLQAVGSNTNTFPFTAANFTTGCSFRVFCNLTFTV